MYLLHITDSEDGSLPEIQLRLHVDDIPQYAILSHRWGRPEDEPTFQDLIHQTASGKQKKGYQKILSFCSQALEYGLSWAWVDTCCIDKSSSAELSEAINSMYAWYEASRICFAYMEDVPPCADQSKQYYFFRRSAWFKRGWTLQELIAPDEVMFFDNTWNKISYGSKSTLSDIISLATGIPKDVLNNKAKLHSASVAQKMSWAASRQTTRIEDEAYSLMGIFGVDMPTVYGEGKKAFRRLQEEIMRHSPDHTIFAWKADTDDMYDGMLATSPRPFRFCGHCQDLKYVDFVDRFDMRNANLEPYYFTTNFGLQIQLPVVSMSPHFEGNYFAFLAAAHAENGASAIIFLRQRSDRPKGHFSRIRFNGQTVIYRPIPEGGYSEFATATKLLISGNEQFDSGPPTSMVQSIPISYAKFSIGLSKSQKTPVHFIVQHTSFSEFTTNEVSNIYEAQLYPAETLPITVLTQGRHVAALLHVSDIKHPLKNVVVVAAFGLQGGEPWVFVDACQGRMRDLRKSLDAEEELMEHLSSSEMFSGASIWQKGSKSIVFLRRDGFGHSWKHWSFGGETENGGLWLLGASIKRSDRSHGRSDEYLLHFET